MSFTPKILNLSAPTVRNLKTLIWLQQTHSSTVNWNKWDSVVTSIQDYYYWSSKSNVVGIVLNNYTGNIDEFLKDLFEISKNVPLILLSQEILSVKTESFWAENFDNIMNLDTIHQHYPFIYKPWDNTIQDAVAIFSILCRYNRLIDCPVKNRYMYDIILESNVTPNPIWIITQFFKHKNKKRYQEIKKCLIKNCANPYIDNIVLLNEIDYSKEWATIPGSNKISQFIISERLTYSDFLKFVVNNVPDNIFTILCNADMYFGRSLQDLWKINMTDRMLALLRWDDDGNNSSKIFGPRADSQDSWIFLSNSIKDKPWNYYDFNFQLGQPGCDNAFAGLILQNRFVISNPSLTFKTYHLHNSNIRNYDKKDYIKKDLYINIAPTYLIDTKQEFTPNTQPICICNELVSFEVKSSSLSNEITYCTMLEKDGRYKWEPSVENHYFEPAIPIYNWKKACVTPNGLVYDLYRIYTGKYALSNDTFNYWKNSDIDIFTPLQSRPRMFAIPFSNTNVFKQPDVYILQYISRCARLLKDYPNTHFWIPKEFNRYFKQFKINTQLGVTFDERTGCWADEVIGLLPSPSSLELGREDITVLRSILPNWLATPFKYVCTVISDNIITEQFITILQNFLLTKNSNWNVRVVYENDYVNFNPIIGSSLCIFIGGQKSENKWSKLWALPNKSNVIEFQQELLIDGEFQHLAHVSDLSSWVLLLSKGSTQDIQEQIMEQLEKWWKKNSNLI